jgi:CheY-like chemotaxis protein
MKGNGATADQDQIAAKMLPGIKALIVDSSEINRDIFSGMLKNWGMCAAGADNGPAALDLLENARKEGHPFRLAILDSEIVGADGFEVLRQMQTNRDLNCEVIMLVSLKRRTADIEQCRALGVKHFLTKPIGQFDLLDTILSTITAKAAEERIVNNSASGPSKPAPQTLKILLCEDNAVNQKLAIRLLEKGGHRVTLARTGREAVTAWENPGEPGFDVVLMDIQMPEMDGMEATAEIRSREKQTGKRVPILAMTAHAMRGDRERCLENGMDGYISKPIHPVELFAEIERCLGLQKGNNPMPEKSQKMQDLIDRPSLLERVEGDQGLLTEMIQIFMEEAPALLDSMRESLRAGNMALLERSAHSLKGAVSNLSSKAATSAALKLEQDAKEYNAQSAKESLTAVEEVMKLLVPALSELCQGVSK